MSHEHRDDHQLADHDVVEPEPIVQPAPAPAVANSDAERRAAERRKAEGVPEQTTEHQFTGDLPEPSRGGTDTETRIVFEDGGAEDDSLAKQAGAARRGPPPPRAQQHADEGSWAAPPPFDAVGTGASADRAVWVRGAAAPEWSEAGFARLAGTTARIASDLDAMWSRSSA